MNMGMLIELSTISVKGTEDTNFDTIFRYNHGQCSMREFVGAKYSIE